MLSLFPDLLFLREISPFILRLTLGAIILMRGYKKYKTEFKDSGVWIGMALELIGGALLLAGFLTQAAAAIVAVDRIGAFWKNKGELNFLMIVVAISLIFLGPGAFSIDFPF